jgi:predicted ester cyclase
LTELQEENNILSTKPGLIGKRKYKGGFVMSIEENKALVRRYYEKCNAIKGDPTKVRVMVDEFFAPDFVGHGPVSGDMNFEVHKRYRTNQYTAIPDLNWIVDDMIAEGDKVVPRAAARGTHKGEYQGIAATGRSISAPGVDIYRIAGDKFVELWACLDTLGLMQQLGVIPSR